MIQFIVDQFLDKVTLHDLVNPEKESRKIFDQLLTQNSFNLENIRAAMQEDKLG